MHGLLTLHVLQIFRRLDSDGWSAGSERGAFLEPQVSRVELIPAKRPVDVVSDTTSSENLPAPPKCVDTLVIDKNTTNFVTFTSWHALQGSLEI